MTLAILAKKQLFPSLKAVVLATSCAFLTMSIHAQTPVDSSAAAGSVAESIMAKPLEPVTLQFPSELRISGNEGWVQLSYIVDKEGNVKDPIVEASIGGPAFDKTAKEALNSLKYTPATFKGTKVEQAVSGEVVEFLLDQTFEGVDTGYSTAYAEIIVLYQSNDTAGGDDALEKLSKSQDLTIQELSMMELLRSYSAGQRNLPLQQLQHLRNATVRDGMYLPKEMLVTALQTRFALASKYSLFQEAFASYTFLEQIDPLNEKLTTLAMAVVPMQKAIEAGQIIIVEGTIGEHGHWNYIPMRRIFAFHSAEEGVTEIEPRCDNKNQRFTVNTQNEWKIPDSWGECSIVVYGTPGAKFELMEYANLPAS